MVLSSNETAGQQSLKTLSEQKAEIEQNLKQIEQQIYNLEGNYLEETWSFGNVVKGFEGYSSVRARNSNSIRKVRFKDSDRIFSNSSYTLTPNGSLASSGTELASFAANAAQMNHSSSDQQSEKKREKKVAGSNVVFVDDSTNPTRKSAATSALQRDIVFKTNRPKRRKLSASTTDEEKSVREQKVTDVEAISDKTLSSTTADSSDSEKEE